MAGKKSISPEDRFAGERLRVVRLERGLSQSTLALRAGITFQQVQKYEKGTNRMSVGRLWSFATILGVPITELLPTSRLVEGAAVDPMHVLAQTSAGQRFARAYNEIRDDDVRHQLVRLIEVVGVALGEAEKKRPPRKARA